MESTQSDIENAAPRLSLGTAAARNLAKTKSAPQMQGIISYLVSAYYSVAVLAPDALGALENVEIAR